MPEIVCLGELLVDFCATEPDVPLAKASGFTKAPGGAPANVAVAASRLGSPAGFIGSVGSDAFGDFLSGVLTDEGVDVSALVRGRATTPLAFVGVHSDGASDFAFYHQGGLTALTAEDIDQAYVATARALHFGSISRICDAARAATDKARRIAAEAGLIVSYDPNYRPRLWEDVENPRRRILEGFQGATVTKVSQEEWRFILGVEDFRCGADMLLEMGLSLVIRSEGAAGASFASASVSGHIDGFRVNSVEFTGAGDAFVASILTDLVSLPGRGGEIAQLGEDQLAKIVRRANAVGALATTAAGAIPALPTRAQVDAFLAGK